MTVKVIRRVGLLGLGKMGQPMARHLLVKGFEVMGYDVVPAALRAAKALGAEIAKSPADIAAWSDLVIIVVGFDSQVDGAMFGPEGILEGAKPGLVISVCSTVSPVYMKELGARIKSKKISLIDAPLCRGEPAAEAGKLLVMVGGEKALYEVCRPAFSAFSDSIHYLGKLGAGQVGKMVNNLILWACISANDEGLKLARALGVEQEPLRLALLQSSAKNWALETWLMQRDMPWAEKDMTIVLQEADEARVSLPLCGVIKEVIKGIKIERGHGMPKVSKK